MSYDLSNVQASNGKPSGKFTLRVLAAKIKKTQKGEDMFSVEFCIVGENFAKFKVFDSFMLQGNGADIGMSKLAYLMDQLGVERTLDNVMPWLNKLVEAELGQDKNGYTRVKEYFAATVENTPDSEF